ncbi:MT-A70 family methyltransferase [Chitinispirillales bacterium ANBcel5]|uniref:MT-A70 family methyltransferase n=1 Tax=Cellulosispirillum alkaliphilum TaxID=3039283 RepID=UPI002A5377E1|nr:MT-A70 family methyltransferase [Chitinispirillales bacterium ANBcel5]
MGVEGVVGCAEGFVERAEGVVEKVHWKTGKGTGIFLFPTVHLFPELGGFPAFSERRGGWGSWFDTAHHKYNIVCRVITAKRGKHPEKPDDVYRIIEKAYPTLKKIELFARKDRKGWKRW